MPLKTIDGVQLTTEQYDQYVLFYSGKNNKYVNNKPLKEELREMFSSNEYNAGTDGPEGTKSLMIRAVFQKYKQAAKQMMKEKNHDVMNDIRKKQIEKQTKLGIL